ncbi:MAG: hypothetical protein KGL39_22230 [Patescibacteria group bacterium]|nr:hypothetical protein [Patescibacteria group bacterium]
MASSVKGAFGRQQVDPILAKDQLQGLQHILKAWGPEYLCSAFLWILTKFASDVGGGEVSRIVPFSWNRIQRHLYGRLWNNNRLLKARQAGFTTFFVLVRLLLPIVTEGGKAGMLVSQNSRYATQHFMMVRRAYRLFGAVDPYDNNQNALCVSLKNNLLHTAYSNRKELVFDYLDSKLIVESAEVEEAGQGVTIQHLVCSEVARWPGDPESTMSNLLGALTPGGTRDEESTANGAAGYYYEQYLRSMDNEVLADARSHFYGWWWSDEYVSELTPVQEAELLADLTSDEIALIRKIHSELEDVAYAPGAAA